MEKQPGMSFIILFNLYHGAENPLWRICTNIMDGLRYGKGENFLLYLLMESHHDYHIFIVLHLCCFVCQ